MTAQTDDPDVVLIQHLMLIGVRFHLLQHHAILFQHYPVPRFKPVSVKEAPGVALPAFDLAAAPEKYGSDIFGDRGIAADDDEIAAGAAPPGSVDNNETGRVR